MHINQHSKCHFGTSFTDNINSDNQVSSPKPCDFERTPVCDEINLSQKPKKSGLLKSFAKKILENSKKYELKKINDKYENLITRLPEVRQTFKEVFMRDDLTEQDTLEMLKEYHKTEIIKITKSGEEYANALFNLALKNYGLDHAGIKLKIETYKKSKAAGGWHAHLNTVVCKQCKNPDDYFTIIHHELRHAKQTQSVAENLSEKDFKEYFKRLCYNVVPKDGTVNHVETFEEFEQNVLTPDFLEYVMIPVKQLARVNPPVTENSLLFAEKMKNAELNYTDCDEDMGIYWNCDNERDARDAEIKIAKLFGVDESKIKFYEKMDKKYLIAEHI